MVLRGSNEEVLLETLIIECECGNEDEVIRFDFWVDEEGVVEEVMIRVRRPRVGLWRWLRDFFRGRFWVEVLAKPYQLRELCGLIEKCLEEGKKKGGM